MSHSVSREGHTSLLQQTHHMALMGICCEEPCQWWSERKEGRRAAVKELENVEFCVCLGTCIHVQICALSICHIVLQC